MNLTQGQFRKSITIKIEITKITRALDFVIILSDLVLAMFREIASKKQKNESHKSIPDKKNVVATNLSMKEERSRPLPKR